MLVTFTTTIQQAEGMDATGISAPPDVVEALGKGKRPPVIVSIAGHTYRSTVSAYRGPVFMLPLSKEHRAAAGVSAGDEVEVTLELDTAPRTVEVPPDLAAALGAVPGARGAFDALAFTHRKEHVRSVEEAKTAATRERRIAAVVAKVTESPG